MVTRQLTVLQILPELEAGGVERGTLEVAGELVRRGHRSIVISAGGRLVDSLERAGSQHVSCPVGKKSPFTLRWIGFLRKFMRDQQVDIVHVRSRLPAWITWLAWMSLPKSSRPHFITTVHGLYSPNAYSRIMTRGEAVIAVSRTIVDYIAKNYPETPRDRVRLIYRGVDPAEFPHGFTPDAQWRESFYRQFPQTLGKPLITLPGRITRLKGHTDFITLMSRLKQQGINCHGLIVGGEDTRKAQYAAELRDLIQQAGLSQDITFTGHRSDVREVFSLSRIVLSLSSKPESFGRTVLETLSLGVPVVGYAHGGVGEILNDVFPTGAVAQGNIDQLTKTVCQLLSQPPTCVPAVQGYRLSLMLNQTVGLYEQMANIHPETSHLGKTHNDDCRSVDCSREQASRGESGSCGTRETASNSDLLSDYRTKLPRAG